MSPQVKGAVKRVLSPMSLLTQPLAGDSPREVWRWSRGGGGSSCYSWGQLLALAEDVKRVFSATTIVYLFCSHMFPLPQN